MDLPSAEKGLPHQLLSCPTEECPKNAALCVKPCQEPVLQTPPTKRRLSFSEQWPDNMEAILNEAPGRPWDVETSSGKKIRLSGAHTGFECVPGPKDFPLTLEPVSEDTLLSEELEKLHLEEQLLMEQLLLVELEEKKNMLNKVNLDKMMPKPTGPVSCFLAAMFDGLSKKIKTHLQLFSLSLRLKLPCASIL